MPFRHNNTLANNEPDWGTVDKAALPREAFADPGEPEKKSTWGYPHHWIKGGTKKDDNGIWTDGIMYLHKGGLDAAWAAANGARSDQQASPAVKTHLQAHRRALGLDKPAKEKGESYPLLAADFFGKCWALTSAKMDELVALATSILEGKQISWPEAATGKSGLKAWESYQVQDGVAVIPVMGILDKRMNIFMKTSGGTSYELLAADIRQAAADPNIKAILLQIDSPGGSVDGVMTAGDAVLAVREQKPVVAFADGQMASGAYWIGSAAGRIVAPPISHIGSIGVRVVHTDRSAQDAMMGLKRTVIYSGKYKNVGSDTGPLSPEDQQVLQGRTDYLMDLFVNAVAAHRGQDPETVNQDMGDGRLFIGQQALDAGLVDQIGTFDDALALAKSMASKPGQGGMNMDKATLESQHPELFAEVKALGAEEGKDAATQAGKEAGIKEERERVIKIFKAAGGQGLLLQVLENGTAHVEALELFLVSHEQAKAEALKAMHGAMPPPLGTDPVTTETHEQEGQGASLETRAKAEWDKDAKLRAEFFGKFENYLIYKRHEEADDIKQVGK